MLVNKGDKIVLVKEMAMFKNVGEVCEVVEVDENNTIYFKFGNGLHLGVMSPDEADRYFKKYEEPKTNTVTKEMVDAIMECCEVKIYTTFNKCTIVSVRLPNGFVITESSACVDPRNYNEKMGFEICMNKIVNKVWELEGYRLQCELYDNSCCCCDYECDEYDDDCMQCNGGLKKCCDGCPEKDNCIK